MIRKTETVRGIDAVPKSRLTVTLERNVKPNRFGPAKSFAFGIGESHYRKKLRVAEELKRLQL